MYIFRSKFKMKFMFFLYFVMLVDFKWFFFIGNILGILNYSWVIRYYKC